MGPVKKHALIIVMQKRRGIGDLPRVKNHRSAQPGGIIEILKVDMHPPDFRQAFFMVARQQEAHPVQPFEDALTHHLRVGHIFLVGQALSVIGRVQHQHARIGIQADGRAAGRVFREGGPQGAGRFVVGREIRTEAVGQVEVSEVCHG
ncbi:MAG: hypothetical protein BWX80_03853 [Candidatus Hydrogenedentes bacterium ADurb.Bin101]|nr:MAG: hypothetical protein BWX80_03853 [Candidatus Hydrogenedentes bacterium ADurb.Bin101]